MKNKILSILFFCATASIYAQSGNEDNSPRKPYQSQKRDRDESSEDRPKKLQRQRTPENSPESTSSSHPSNIAYHFDDLITQENSPLSPEGQLELLTIYNHLHLSDQEYEGFSDADTQEDSDIENDFLTPPHIHEITLHTPQHQNQTHDFIFTTPEQHQLIPTGAAGVFQDIDQAVMTPDQLFATHIVTP